MGGSDFINGGPVRNVIVIERNDADFDAPFFTDGNDGGGKADFGWLQSDDHLVDGAGRMFQHLRKIFIEAQPRSQSLAVRFGQISADLEAIFRIFLQRLAVFVRQMTVADDQTMLDVETQIAVMPHQQGYRRLLEQQQESGNKIDHQQTAARQHKNLGVIHQQESGGMNDKLLQHFLPQTFQTVMRIQAGDPKREAFQHETGKRDDQRPGIQKDIQQLRRIGKRIIQRGDGDVAA